ncbi:transcriptional regulator, partial [Pseudomonas sp. SIMBA_068]
EVLAANASTGVLFELVGIPPNAADGINLLTTLLQTGGLGDHLINAEEIRSLAWQRATREALGNPGLATLLAGLPTPAGTELPGSMPPLV